MLRMRPRRRYYTIPLGLGLAILMSWFLVGAVSKSPGATQVQGGRPATEAEEIAFHDLYERARRLAYESKRTCDPADIAPLTTVYINDPAIKLPEAAGPLLVRWADTLPTVLGPTGAQPGFLSAQVANTLHRCGNVEAWEAIEAKAAAEGKQPNPDDLPEGMIPMERIEASYHGNEFVVHTATVDDDENHAVADLVFISESHYQRTLRENPDPDFMAWERIYFSKVDGQWYMSAWYHCEPVRYGHRVCQD